VKTDAAGKQAVTVGILHQHSRSAAGRPHAAGHQMSPGIEITPAVANNSSLASRSRRRMHTQDVIAGDGEHAEWIVAA